MIVLVGLTCRAYDRIVVCTEAAPISGRHYSRHAPPTHLCMLSLRMSISHHRQASVPISLPSQYRASDRRMHIAQPSPACQDISRSPWRTSRRVLVARDYSGPSSLRRILLSRRVYWVRVGGDYKIKVCQQI